jgi:hypothetical protein
MFKKPITNYADHNYITLIIDSIIDIRNISCGLFTTLPYFKILQHRTVVIYINDKFESI